MVWIPSLNLQGTDMGQAKLHSDSIVGVEGFVFPAGSGAPISISETSSPGTLIHAAGSIFKDELWFYANNLNNVDRTLNLQFGGITTTNKITMTIPSGSFVPILPGMVIGNNAELRAYVDVANSISVAGNVNQR